MLVSLFEYRKHSSINLGLEFFVEENTKNTLTSDTENASKLGLQEKIVDKFFLICSFSNGINGVTNVNLFFSIFL